MARGAATAEARSESTFMEEALDHAVVGYEEQVPVLRRAQQGDKAAVAEVFRMNMKFIHGQTVRYAKKARLDPKHWDDARQDACEAILTKALPKWNPAKGKFTTYAGWWIFSVVMRYAQKFGFERPLTSGLLKKQRELRKATIEVANENGGSVSHEDAAERAGISQEWKDRLRAAQQRDVALDATDDGTAGSLARRAVPATSGEEVDTAVDVAKMLQAMEDCLTDEQRRLVALRFMRGLTRDEAAPEFRIGRPVSRELARIVECEAMGKLCIALGLPDVFPLLE